MQLQYSQQRQSNTSCGQARGSCFGVICDARSEDEELSCETFGLKTIIKDTNACISVIGRIDNVTKKLHHIQPA